MTRKTQQVEVRMISEYLLNQYPTVTSITNVPLGKVDETLQREQGYQRALGISRPYRPKIDAIVVQPGALIMIEAKVWNVVAGCAKLPVYKSLVPVTPELQKYKGLPIIMELVVGWTNDNLQIMAASLDVRIRVFSPAWLQDVVDRMHTYWTKEYRVARADKLAMRETFGLE